MPNRPHIPSPSLEAIRAEMLARVPPEEWEARERARLADPNAPRDGVLVEPTFDIRRPLPAVTLDGFRHGFARRVFLGDPCAYCGGAGGTLDHVEPTSLGGGHHFAADNATGACRRCNSRKGAASLLLFLQRSAQAARTVNPNTEQRPRAALET